ncbi:hypothetical protein DFQ28_010175 [Apophysomyces sp. BC1034]|nr:hypothetical protein DFQ28_010175 [Apophysomyces sp. BC1034]
MLARFGSPSVPGATSHTQPVYLPGSNIQGFIDNNDVNFMETPSLDFEYPTDHGFDDDFSIQTDNSNNTQTQFQLIGQTTSPIALYTPSCYARPFFPSPSNPELYDYLQLDPSIGRPPLFEERRPEKQSKEKRHICPICFHR